jgi:hypothetical protein
MVVAHGCVMYVQIGAEDEPKTTIRCGLQTELSLLQAQELQLTLAAFVAAGFNLMGERA